MDSDLFVLVSLLLCGWHVLAKPKLRVGYLRQVDHVLVQDALSVGGLDLLRKIVEFARQCNLTVQHTYGQKAHVLAIAPEFDARHPARVLVGDVGVSFLNRLRKEASFVYIMVVRDPFRWALSSYLQGESHVIEKFSTIPGNIIRRTLSWYTMHLDACPQMRLERVGCPPCESRSILNYWAQRLPPEFNGSDVQNEMLWHLGHYTLILLYERYDESLEMLAALFDVHYSVASPKDIWRGVWEMSTNESLGQYNIGQLVGNTTMSDVISLNRLISNTLSADMYSVARRRFEADYLLFNKEVAKGDLPLRVCWHHRCPSLRTCVQTAKEISSGAYVKGKRPPHSVADLRFVDHVLIYHFPKTGGTSLVEFVKALAISRRLTLQHAYKGGICNYDKKDCQGRFFNLRGFDPKHPAQIIIGHNVSFAFAYDFLPATSKFVFITMFREPLDWAISRYFYLRDPVEETNSDDLINRVANLFDTYQTCPRMMYLLFDCYCERRGYMSSWARFAPESSEDADGITRQLDYVSLALLTERYSDSLKLLASAFGTSLDRIRVPHTLRSNNKNLGQTRMAFNILPRQVGEHLRLERFLADRTKIGDIYPAARNKFRVDHATWLKEGSFHMRVFTPAELKYAGACFDRHM